MSLRSFRTNRAAAAFALLVWLCAGIGAARPRATPTPAPTPTPVADPAITKIVRQQFVAWQSGVINKSLYEPALQEKMTDQRVNDTSTALAKLGAVTDLTYLGPLLVNEGSDLHGYVYQVHCAEGTVYAFLIIDAQGKISNFTIHDKLTTETVEVPAAPEGSPPPSP